MRRSNHGAEWTPDQEQRLHELIRTGVLAQTIARNLGRSIESVASKARRDGLAMNKRRSCLTGRMTIR